MFNEISKGIRRYFRSNSKVSQTLEKKGERPGGEIVNGVHTERITDSAVLSEFPAWSPVREISSKLTETVPNPDYIAALKAEANKPGERVHLPTKSSSSVSNHRVTFDSGATVEQKGKEIIFRGPSGEDFGKYPGKIIYNGIEGDDEYNKWRKLHVDIVATNDFSLSVSTDDISRLGVIYDGDPSDNVSWRFHNYRDSLSRFTKFSNYSSSEGGQLSQNGLLETPTEVEQPKIPLQYFLAT